MRRAHRAARFAAGFALQRQDLDVAVIQEAALLHEFAEMLLWLHAPALALAVQARQQAQPDDLPELAQRAVLHIALPELQQALMKAWHLPALLVQISDDEDSSLHQVRNVQLAIRVARHSASGWHHPALPEDVDAVARLLGMGVAPSLHLLHQLDDA